MHRYQTLNITKNSLLILKSVVPTLITSRECGRGNVFIMCVCVGYNFWMSWHRNFIFGMVLHLDHMSCAARCPTTRGSKIFKIMYSGPRMPMACECAPFLTTYLPCSKPVMMCNIWWRDSCTTGVHHPMLHVPYIREGSDHLVLLLGLGIGLGILEDHRLWVWEWVLLHSSLGIFLTLMTHDSYIVG